MKTILLHSINFIKKPLPKYFILFILLLFVNCNFLKAQLISTYTFTQTTGTYTPIVGTQIIPAADDDGVSLIQNIGFNFTYHGVVYSTYGASSNGYITLGAVSTTNYTPLSGLANCIAFAGTDGRTGGAVTYILSGSSPNRVLTIQYPNWNLRYTSTADYVDAQIKLYETTNIIEIIYGTSARTTSYTPQVGLTGAAVTDFSDRILGASWAATVAGAANTATMTWSTAFYPANGQLYRWDPMALPMTYVSSTVTQPNVTNVFKNTTNNEVICIQVVTSGSTSPLTVSSFDLNTAGTTNVADITNAKLWSTGTSGTFATTTQLGGTVAAPSGAFTINSGANMPFTLSSGTNYFWLTYDVPIGATTNNFIDASCTSLTVGSAQTPTITAPAGNRQIKVYTLDGTFETGNTFPANGMTVVNAATNYWIVGTATNNGGVNSAYITNNGSANTYTINTTSISHFYFDYPFPAGQTDITLEFDWKCFGESGFDGLKVFLVSTATTPVAGVLLGAGQIGSTWYNLQSTWQHVSLTLNPALAGTTQRLVFTWQNDGSVGTDPPAGVDNIRITTLVPCTPPAVQATSFLVTGTTATTASISWVRGNGDNVLVIARAGSAPTDPNNGTAYTANSIYGSGNAVGGGFAVYNGAGTNVTVSGLATGTTYYFAIYEYFSATNCYNKTELTGSGTPVPTNLITTTYNFGGATQLVFDNSYQYTTIPEIRVSATGGVATFNRFQVEINPDASFAGISSFQHFSSGPYTVGTQYNLICNLLSPGITFTNNSTYYIRVRASDDAGATWGSWCTPISFTYKSPTLPLPNTALAQWHQTTYYQFLTDALNGAQSNTGDFAEMSPSIILSRQINASTDDAYDNGVTNFNNTGYAYFGFSGSAYTSGFRFTNITIPPGSTIESAKLSGNAYNSYVSTLNVRISGDNVANSATFTTMPSLRAVTPTTVDLNLAAVIPDQWISNTWHDTPDLSGIVQNIVNLGGWASGNAMSIIVRNNAGTDYRGFSTWDWSPATAPILTIKYSNRSGGTITSTPIYYSSFVGATSWRKLYWSEVGNNGDFRVTIERWNGAAWVNTAFVNLDYNSSGIDISALGTESQIRLVGTFTYAAGGCPKLNDWTVTCEDVSTNLADLTLVYTADNTTPCMGSKVCYTLSCANNGPKEATNIVITSAIPAGLTFVSSSTTLGTYTGSTWTIPALQVGQTETLLLYATVNTGTGGTAIASSATVTSLNQTDPDLSNNTRNITLNIQNNNVPTCSAIFFQITNFNTPTPPIPFTIGDIETPVGSLVVTGFSSNTTLVPNGNIVFGGAGANRTVTITPGLNQYGTCIITIDVADPTCNQQITFQLTVRRNNFGSWIAANIVVGQPNFTTNNTTMDAVTGPGSSSSAISVKGVLAVGSQSNSTWGAIGRILIYNTVPTVNGTAANFVVGKPNMTSNLTGCSQTLMYDVEGVAFSPDGNKLICTDGLNNRVMIWNTIPAVNGAPADIVLGQTNFTTSTSGCSSTKFNYPTGVIVTPNGMLLVCDLMNNRVLVWNRIPTVSNTPADLVIGQPNFTTNTPGSGANQLYANWYCSLSTDGKLAISDTYNNRILIFNSLPTQNGAYADVVIGQDNFGLSGGGLSSTKFQEPVGVTISPTGLTAVGEFRNERVMVWDQIPTSNGTAANFVLGQIDYVHNAIYSDAGGLPSTPSQYNMYSPYGINFDLNDRLFVNGRDMNRVMIFGTVPVQVANLAVTITNDNPNPCISSMVTFTITASNLGPNTATNVIVYTALPIGFTYQSSTATSGTFNNSGGIWSIPTIPNGQTYTLTVTGSVNFGSGGIPLIAYASIRSSNQFDSDYSNNAASTIVTPIFLFAPQISNIVDQTTDMNTTLGPVPFTIHSEDALPLTVTATSSNQLIVMDANIVIGGAGDNRTFTITPQPNKVGVVTITLTVSNGGACSTTETFLLSVGNIWLGYTTDWHTLSNWSRAIPTTTTCAFIPTTPVGGLFPIINAPAVAKDFVLETGTTLTINGAQTLTVSGNWINDGVLIPNNSTVIFNSTSSLTGTGTFQFYNLTINNPGILTSSSGTIYIAGAYTKNGAATFTHNNGTVSFNGLTAQTYTSTNPTLFNNLIINNQSVVGLTLNNEMRVANNANVTFTDGIVNTTAANILTLNVGVTVSGASNASYINGPVKLWFAAATNPGLTTGIFPLGASSNYCPAQINFTTAPTSGGTLTGQFITTLPPDYYSGLPIFDGLQQIDNLANEGFWQIDASGLSGGIYTCTLIGNNFTTVTLPNNIRLLKRPSSGGNWTFDGIHGLGTNPPLTVTRTGMSGFSQFALGGLYFDNNPLPVELLFFNLNCDYGKIKIDWSTASETNNDFFTVERSNDGIQYSTFSIIKGAGNSNNISSYSISDNPSFSGNYYYRLKQTDFNGMVRMLAGKSIDCSHDLLSEPSLFSYPNPFNDYVYFEVRNLSTDNYTVRIMDVLGNLIETKDIKDLKENSVSFSFDMSKYAPGVYYYSFTSGNYVKTGKIIKNQ